MNRREALHLLATAAVLPLAPRSLLAALQQARAVVATERTSGTLNPHQYASVKAIAELILPRTDTPGATDIGAPEFIDLILTEWYEEPEKSRFLTGLTEVDAHTQALFGKDFIECSALQQADCLTAMGEKMEEGTERLHGQARHARGGSPAPEAHFYAMLRRLTLTAYYTSEAGATKSLNFQVIPDRHDACADMSSPNQKAESH